MCPVGQCFCTRTTLLFSLIRIQGPGFSLNFPSNPGASYPIEVSVALTGWSCLEDAGGDHTTFTDAGLPAQYQAEGPQAEECETGRLGNCGDNEVIDERDLVGTTDTAGEDPVGSVIAGKGAYQVIEVRVGEQAGGGEGGAVSRIGRGMPVQKEASTAGTILPAGSAVLASLWR
jgi:hypothetical protein